MSGSIETICQQLGAAVELTMNPAVPMEQRHQVGWSGSDLCLTLSIAGIQPAGGVQGEFSVRLAVWVSPDSKQSQSCRQTLRPQDPGGRRQGSVEHDGC